MTTVEPSYSTGYLNSRWAVLAAGLFLVGTNSFVIAGVLPDIARTLSVSPSEVGYSITVYAVVVAIVAPAISILVPSWSRTKLMVVGLALLAAGTVVAALAPDLAVFTVGRVMAALGGAALVPTATAAAAALAPPARRGQAIAAVGIGFTLSTAIGSPLGTAIAAATNWRVPLLGVAGLALVLMPVLALLVRKVPTAAPISLGRRFAVLRDGRILMPLIATLLVVAGFNLVYIFSAAVSGFSGALLAILLLVYGVCGVIGNTISGPLTDRFGSRVVGTIFLGVEGVALLALVFVGGNFGLLAVVFVVWGLSAFAAVVPVQHRLVAVDPQTAAVAISWFSTALYLGISIAPLLGAAALHTGDVALLPLIGTIVTGVGLLAFQLGFAIRARRRAPEAISLGS